jgi:tetraacyldisaccharide 4'-kinase
MNSLRNALSLYLQSLIDQRKGSKLLSRCWGAWISCRNFLYDIELLPIRRAPVPVVSVGNIVAGGTGKTPLVHLLARTLAPKIRLAILTRGYRGGDEAKLLARRLPDVPVYVGKRRIDSARRAAAEGAKLLLLDDGFQHRKLARDIDCLLLHADDLKRENFYLPRGSLRDSPDRISEATQIFIYPSEPQLMERFPNAIGMGLKVKGFFAKKVAIFAGIARPPRFVRTVEALGMEVVAQCSLVDHEPIGEERLARFAKEAKKAGAEALLCTEKDWVKLDKNRGFALPVHYLEMEMEVVAGQERWDSFIELIRQKVDNYPHYGSTATQARREHS